MRVLMCFDGTGIEGAFQSIIEESKVAGEGVIRVYFKGCHASQTGGSDLAPNLSKVCDNITKCFNQNELDLDKLKKKFGNAIVIEPFDAGTTQYGKVTNIEEIACAGYSRGAITAFLAAKKLFLSKNNTPVRIFANQPVPGNSYEGLNTLVSEVVDLSMCTNIRSATVVIGSYVKRFGFSGLKKGVSFFHNVFFKQVAPFFPKEINAELIECPIQSHFSVYGVGLGYLHLLNALDKHQYCNVKNMTGHIKYKMSTEGRIFLFNTQEKQSIFGDKENIKPDPLLLELIDEQITPFLEWYFPYSGLEGDQEALLASLNLEQKKAIYSLALGCTEEQISNIDLINMMSMIVANQPSGKKLIEVINLSSSVIAHTLSSFMGDGDKKEEKGKHSFLCSQIDAYLHQLFLLSYQFISNPNPNEEVKNKLIQDLTENNKKILNKTTNKRRNKKWDACVTVIQNIVLGILTGGGIFIYNQIKHETPFVSNKTETYTRLFKGTQKISKNLLDESPKKGPSK
jgi:hypothetical protein